MKPLTPSAEIFSTYTLSPKEEYEGQRLNEFQRMYLHNLRAQKADAKLRMIFTPDNIVDFAQQDAYLAAQIELLDALLAPLNPPQTNEE